MKGFCPGEEPACHATTEEVLRGGCGTAALGSYLSLTSIAAVACDLGIHPEALPKRACASAPRGPRQWAATAL